MSDKIGGLFRGARNWVDQKWFRTFYNVQDPGNVARLLRRRGEPWPTGVVNNTADLTKMSDEAANAIYELGARHGFDQVIRRTGNFGVEHFFRKDVFSVIPQQGAVMKGEYRLFRQGGGKGAFACVQVERIPGAKAHAEPVRHAQGVAARTPPWCIAAARDGVSGALAALRSLGLETTGESIEINEIGINLVDTTADAIHCAAFLATADAFGAVERFELGYHEQWTVTAL